MAAQHSAINGTAGDKRRRLEGNREPESHVYKILAGIKVARQREGKEGIWMTRLPWRIRGREGHKGRKERRENIYVALVIQAREMNENKGKKRRKGSR